MVKKQLSEGAKNIQQLPNNCSVVIRADPEWNYFNISFDNGPPGYIDAEKAEFCDHGKCDDAFEVVSVAAQKGWGPLLYDIAMEFASKYGGGLMADRESVSSDAKKVWQYYLYRRSDVKAYPLEDQEDEDEELANRYVKLNTALLDLLAAQNKLKVIMGESHMNIKTLIRTVLRESALSSEDIPENMFVKIESVDEENTKISITDDSGDKFLGHITIGPPDSKEGPCESAWIVRYSWASQGWGPLLYDIAMEYASLKAGGLTPDRKTVSPDARKIWDYYFSKRKGDVKNVQLDNLDNEITDVKIDNCVQSSAENLKFTDHWVNSPLSKRYTKSPTTLKKLKDLNKIKIV